MVYVDDRYEMLRTIISIVHYETELLLFVCISCVLASLSMFSLNVFENPGTVHRNTVHLSCSVMCVYCVHFVQNNTLFNNIYDNKLKKCICPISFLFMMFLYQNRDLIFLMPLV